LDKEQAVIIKDLKQKTICLIIVVVAKVIFEINKNDIKNFKFD
jgi:hypothetical protein